jgi:hypothetical protein
VLSGRPAAVQVDSTLAGHHVPLSKQAPLALEFLHHITNFVMVQHTASNATMKLYDVRRRWRDKATHISRPLFERVAVQIFVMVIDGCV